MEYLEHICFHKFDNFNEIEQFLETDKLPKLIQEIGDLKQSYTYFIDSLNN